MKHISSFLQCPIDVTLKASSKTEFVRFLGDSLLFLVSENSNEVSALTMLEYGVIHQCQKGTAGDGSESKWIGSMKGMRAEELLSKVPQTNLFN